MTFEEYTNFVRSTALGPANELYYPVLGLAGEAEEVAEKFKKLIRDHNGEMSEEYKQEILKELGDVLWYITKIADNLDTNLKEVVEINVSKLQSRKDRDIIHGKGDNR